MVKEAMSFSHHKPPPEEIRYRETMEVARNPWDCVGFLFNEIRKSGMDTDATVLELVALFDNGSEEHAYFTTGESGKVKQLEEWQKLWLRKRWIEKDKSVIKTILYSKEGDGHTGDDVYSRMDETDVELGKLFEKRTHLFHLAVNNTLVTPRIQINLVNYLAYDKKPFPKGNTELVGLLRPVTDALRKIVDSDPHFEDRILAIIDECLIKRDGVRPLRPICPPIKI